MTIMIEALTMWNSIQESTIYSGDWFDDHGEKGGGADGNYSGSASSCLMGEDDFY